MRRDAPLPVELLADGAANRSTIATNRSEPSVPPSIVTKTSRADRNTADCSAAARGVAAVGPRQTREG